jgi:hypothetical protein
MRKERHLTRYIEDVGWKVGENELDDSDAAGTTHYEKPFYGAIPRRAGLAGFLR